MCDQRFRNVEALASAQIAWSEKLDALVKDTVVLSRVVTHGGLDPICGKKRVLTSYPGGSPNYHDRFARITASGYVGSTFAEEVLVSGRSDYDGLIQSENG